jgi:hypothetical protein
MADSPKPSADKTDDDLSPEQLDAVDGGTDGTHLAVEDAASGLPTGKREL